VIKKGEMGLKKVTFQTAGLFSLKKYFDSHLNCRSYEYPMAYTLRSAILGTIIELDGVKKAKELFPYVKNAILYVQYPSSFQKNQVKLRRRPNSYYSSDEDKSDSLLGMGVREYVDVSQIVFYIDNTIPDIDVYLNNIEHIGNSQGFVFLESIEEVNQMEQVLMEWVEERDGDVPLFEMYDWSPKAQFEHIYFYHPDWYKRPQIRKICCVHPVVAFS
jgi:hypothetical protein